jgi:hypothetical protein
MLTLNRGPCFIADWEDAQRPILAYGFGLNLSPFCYAASAFCPNTKTKGNASDVRACKYQLLVCASLCRAS